MKKQMWRFAKESKGFYDFYFKLIKNVSKYNILNKGFDYIISFTNSET